MVKRPDAYSLWAGMIQRCHNPNNPKFYMYGARGITVCDEWRKSFKTFADHMGPRPSGFSIDRIDNGGNYEPGNVRWADIKAQSRNKRTNRFLEFNGERLLICDWSAKTGISSPLISQRLNKLGWSVARTLSTPPDKAMYKHGLVNSIAAKARRANVSPGLVYNRMKRGISLEHAIAMPLNSRKA